METTQNNQKLSQVEIEAKVISIVEEMTADWELDLSEGIQLETQLIADLAFESIDVVQLVVALEQKFNRKGLPFQDLFMQDGDYVEEILVKEVSEFMGKHL